MIRPLDLQTLYMNLDKIGKEQAQSKEAQATAQANQVLKMQKEHDQGAHAVGKTNPTLGAEGDTSVKVQADDKQPGAGNSPPKRKKKPIPDETETEEKDNAWKDPELGKHIDLSG